MDDPKKQVGSRWIDISQNREVYKKGGIHLETDWIHWREEENNIYNSALLEKNVLGFIYEKSSLSGELQLNTKIYKCLLMSILFK